MEDRVVCQWDKDSCDDARFIKIDFLALGMLSLVEECVELIASKHGHPPDLSRIDFDDAAVYDQICSGDTVGLFQIESRAQIQMVRRTRPQNLEDLAMEVAIVRPGPIVGGMVHPYFERRRGRQPVVYPHPSLEPILERTLAIPLFQEQILRIAMVAAGFTGGEADALRRAISNWGRNSKLLTFEEKLKKGMKDRGYSPEFADRLFDQIKGFGGYGFPESHSASFALLAYISAWLKCHHPAAFYVGLLNSQPMGFYTPSQLIQDAGRHGVSVLAADVSHSDWDHQLLPQANQDQPPIRLGLRLIRGLGADAGHRITSARRQQPFESIGDLRCRAQLDKRDMEALASADALNSLSGHRYRSQWQVMGLQAPRPLLTATDQSITKDSWDNCSLPTPSIAENVMADYQATGLSLREHPMKLLRHREPFNQCRRYSDLAVLGNNRFVRIAGIVTCRQRPGSASGVIFLTLEDETGNHNVVVWPRVQDNFREALMTAQLLLVKGTLECRDGVMHVIAGALFDHSPALADLRVKSRDFH